ncbi:hypothetical protein BDB01DRAFT_909341 [Pilobolus umbonatus]|nr:hypothetical protein BDB01DRAFT_909341 [Pilobolus umbonatus]
MSLHSYNSSINNFSGSTTSSRSQLSDLDDVGTPTFYSSPYSPHHTPAPSPGLGAADFFNTAVSPLIQPLQQQVEHISPISRPLQQQGDIPFFFLPPPIFEEAPYDYEDMDMDMSPPPSPSYYSQFIDDPMELYDPMDVDEWEVNVDYMDIDF